MGKKKVSKRWTEDDARRVIADVERSGLSDKAYARKHGLKSHRLWWWRRRLAKAQAVEFVEVKSKPTNPEVLEIRLTNGRVVVSTTAIDPSVLANMLDAIEGRRC